ncbi:MAG: insulinase family protein [Bacteroidales bacterium]|nr:insulinase family protein [Bacteroidales bacterium]MCL2133610.1 insulinase family protein [Bacteroidales bacterium]
MKKLFTILSFLLLMILTVSAQTEKIKFIEYDLPNGLHVILHQDHNTPNVVVSLMYHVGAKNEDPERTGFAHLFEHLMFEGSQNIARGDYFKIVQAAGGELNANTTQDRTYYFEMMPANQLELALWMEAERMLHANIDSIGVATQKGVVIEERNQSYDSRPYGTFMEELGKRAFTTHPYRWQTIGDPEHIRNSTFDDVFNFYKTYYVPNNTVLVVVGDIDEAQTKVWIEKYFGDIPRGDRPMNRPTVVEPPLAEEVRDVVYDKVQLPGVFMGYRAPAMNKEAYAVEILCKILYGGNSSRFKTNIDDKGLAMQTLVFPYILEHPGLTYVVGIPNVGVTVESLEEAMTAEFERVQNELVSEDEFKMAMASKEFEVAGGLTRISNIAQSLANNYTYFRDAERINQELSFYQDITREDLQEVAQKYFHRNNRVVLYYLPESEKD